MDGPQPPTYVCLGRTPPTHIFLSGTDPTHPPTVFLFVTAPLGGRPAAAGGGALQELVVILYVQGPLCAPPRFPHERMEKSRNNIP